MKRLANYLIALALMAFTFTSCEDVPNPFGQILPPNGGGDEEVFVAEGNGTLADPYNVQGVLEYVTALGADVQSDKEVYVKGYVITIKEQFSSQYGNAQFTMSDSKEGGNTFTFYRGLYLGNQKWVDGNATLSEGDEVIVCGKVVNYKGTTPETVQNAAYVYSLNGKTEGGGGGDTPTPTGDAKGTGTQADPYNAAGANKYIATLTADTESEKEIFIKGKLVKYANNGEFNAQYGNASFYLSEDGTENSDQFYVFRTLYLGNVKYTEGATPKVGDEIVICGKVVNYKGNTPETVANKSYIYSWEGNTSGGGDTPTPSGASGTGTKDDPFNIAAAIAKCQEIGETASADKYYIKGIVVTGGKVSGGYGNVTFKMGDTKDATDLFTAYQVAGSDGEKLADGYEVKAGDEVIVYGPICNYKGNTPETSGKSAAQIVTINGKKTNETSGGGSGGGETGGTGADGSTIITVADFNAAAVSTDVWYQLTGTIKNLKDGDQYGNFDLEDSTGSVYVYGVLSEKGGAKKKFQDLVTAKGIANGKTITIVGNRGEYNGKIEVLNAYFIKVE